MSQSPRLRVDPSIIAALIGLIGTVSVAVISTLSSRSAARQGTAVVTLSVESAELIELPAATEAAGLPPVTEPGTQPTAKYPDGKHFRLFYDDNSFYLLNLSDATIPINRVAFERLSEGDVPLNRFTGTRWAEFYASSTPGKCVALEILGSPPYLSPPECGHNAFLSLRTPTREDPTIFWTVQEEGHQFRVLWREGGQEEEIGRCEISAGICDVFLP